MQKKEKPGGLTLPNFKALDMQINGRKMNILETDPHKYGQLFLPMMQMQFNAKKKKKGYSFQQIVLEHIGIPDTNKPWPIPHSLNKNSFKISYI